MKTVCKIFEWFMLVLIILLILLVVAIAARAEEGHDCHLLFSADPEWNVTAEILEGTIHDATIYLKVKTTDGCECMIEMARADGKKVPAKGVTVKLFGLTTGIPGFTKLHLVAVDIEERT